MANTARKNAYWAERNQMTNTWKGCVQFPPMSGPVGAIAKTPESYTTKREALAAIKGQHPGEGR